MKRLAILFVILVSATGVLALAPGERLADPAQEARARELSAELRCLVCQNQSIDDSDADLAKDLRRLVRERIAAGDNDAAVKSYLVQRYGEFVLLKPVFSLRNAVLWLMPFGILILGALAASRLFRRRATPQPSTALTAAEQVELDQLVAPEKHTSITKDS